MLLYYKKVVNYNIKLYIKQFIIIINFLYSYLIKRRILKTTRVLKLKNIYFY